MRRASSISLTPLERAWLEAWATNRPAEDRLSVRARVVLGASSGSTNTEIARALRIHPETVGRWRRRFAVHRLEGVRRDAPRSGGRSGVSKGLVERIVQLTAMESAPNGNPWTTRTLARVLGVNHMVIHRIWKARGLAGSDRPVWFARTAPGRRVRIDLLGMYVGPPAYAIVFGVRATPSEPRGGRTTPPHWISAVHGSTDGPHLPPALAGFLLDIESGRSLPGPRTPTASTPQGLLVFLRGLEEEQEPRSMGLHVVFDRPLDQLPQRVVGWLRSHTRFRPTGTTEGAGWMVAVDEWVRTFSGTVVHPENLRDMGSLLESSAAAGSDLPRGFSWTHGGNAGEPTVPSSPPPTARALTTAPESA